ncbi:hypothetical protein SETIT_1G368500v2 [Setaria italica]|uniref:Uncharacterized protein n=2 Tax=Setaria TaxID=4554 RepID=A0A368PVF5_SETIT|nr:hypothetical protein SETIT_1G368500v2 [Setaria italica]TKW42303.1 hypothetical protein SEVIR_1G375100v2 [Setaria viridis]
MSRNEGTWPALVASVGASPTQAKIAAPFMQCAACFDSRSSLSASLFLCLALLGLREHMNHLPPSFRASKILTAGRHREAFGSPRETRRWIGLIEHCDRDGIPCWIQVILIKICPML